MGIPKFHDLVEPLFTLFIMLLKILPARPQQYSSLGCNDIVQTCRIRAYFAAFEHADDDLWIRPQIENFRIKSFLKVIALHPLFVWESSVRHFLLYYFNLSLFRSRACFNFNPGLKVYDFKEPNGTERIEN